MTETPTLRWQDAVAELADLRTDAETAASRIKRHGDAIAVADAERVYGDGKSATDALIAGLIVTRAYREEPAGLRDLEARLRRATTARDTLADQADASDPKRDAAGEKGPLTDLALKGLAPLVAAIAAIVWHRDSRDDQRRETIQNQLEAARWTPFLELKRE